MHDLLSGLSLVEVSSFVASPTVGLYCGQMGAEVIRVDHVAGGLDYDRYLLTGEGRSLAWENLNRTKKSVALDLRSGEGRELCVALAAKVGQCVTNVPETSFLSHAAMAAKRGDMISLRIMGWHDGRQAMDFTVNAASGYPLMTGPAEWEQASAPPVNQLMPAWDFLTGAYSAFALLAALRRRDASGEGAEIRIPLGDVAIGTLANSGTMAEMLYRGADRERLGNAIWGAFGTDFRSRDGTRFMVAALTAKQWAGLVEAFDVESEIAALEAELGVRFADGDTPRFENRERLAALFQSVAGQLDWPELERRMGAAGTTFERYRTPYEASTDPVLVGENPLFGPSPDNPSGFDYPAARSFAHLGGEERGDPLPAPYLGQHSEEVLAEKLGLSSGAIARLIDAGTVRTSDKETQ
ncbi:CoA transferase [Alteriqipengyuania flavescens]|uniref:CoA transferase n=1 Tax=Alteriqipengyuania flavescens TaxID=3053610 RepID=UPI0025B42918|nr:CoA transferase [Alteriqipengyuania flavescens]WJY19390.1 CoA transferase [Alteriqipengyuania flavescens]WJY25332.1 CoA transferase [Alteriqipengyuania flavescens]